MFFLCMMLKVLLDLLHSNLSAVHIDDSLDYYKIQDCLMDQIFLMNHIGCFEMDYFADFETDYMRSFLTSYNEDHEMDYIQCYGTLYDLDSVKCH